jgi:amino acid adenylation domain-containing protein
MPAPLDATAPATTIPARFAKVVQAMPDASAISAGPSRLTFTELNAAASAVAAALNARLSGSQELVAILVERGPRTVTSLLGVLQAGHVYACLHSPAPADTQRRILAQARPRVIITDRERHEVALICAQAVLPRPDVIIVEDLRPDPVAGIRVPAGAPADPCGVYFTSGSTGEPKGVVLSHEAILNRVRIFSERTRVSRDDRVSAMICSSFGASITHLFSALLNGATLCPFDPTHTSAREIAAWLAGERITMLHPPTALFRTFVDALSTGLRFPLVRFTLTGGDALSADTVRRWRTRVDSGVLWSCYSSTEAGFISIHEIPMDGHIGGEGSVPVGQPAPGLQIDLLDEHERPVTTGDTGHIVVRSEYLASGYWRDPARTSVTFQRDPVPPGRRIYRTGDLGRWNADGLLEHMGRADTTTKIRGFRVVPAEIENALRALPNVRDAIVLPCDANTRLAAYVVADGEPRPTGPSLRTALVATLPAYKVPARIGVLDEFPLTSGGKPDRVALATLQAQPDGSHVSPIGEIERAVAEIFAQVLAVPEVGATDNFFDLGGDSLRVVSLLTEIERRFGTPIASAVIAEEPTVRRISRELTSPGDVRTGTAVLLGKHAVSAGGPPLFVVPGGDGDVVPLASLAEALAPGRRVFGFRSPGIDGEAAPIRSIPAIAAEHARNLRAIYPRGPVLLMGVCWGVSVALEIARLLQSEGREPAVTILLGPTRIGGRSWWARVLRGSPALTVPLFAIDRLKLYARTASRLKGGERWAYLRDKLALARSAVNPTERFRGDRIAIARQGVLNASFAALGSYRPRPYTGKTALIFLARQGPRWEPQARHQWSRLFSQPMIFDASAMDTGIALRPPELTETVRILRSVLDAAADVRSDGVMSDLDRLTVL